ncbi:MAG: hypothetical protein QOJ71_69 [Actinomycetota bacterium]|nr:hypothetical protein [Actinomycetota bacterium]
MLVVVVGVCRLSDPLLPHAETSANTSAPTAARCLGRSPERAVVRSGRDIVSPSGFSAIQPVVVTRRWRAQAPRHNVSMKEATHARGVLPV